MSVRSLGVLLVVCLMVACGQKGVGAKGVPSTVNGTGGNEQLVISEAWVRSVPGDKTAAYFVIHNKTSANAQLLGATIDGVNEVQIHETTTTGDMMSMRQLESVTLPANSEVLFESGGKHLMLMGVKKRWREGDYVTVELVLDGGSQLTFKALVRSGDAGHDGHHH